MGRPGSLQPRCPDWLGHGAGSWEGDVTLWAAPKTLAPRTPNQMLASTGTRGNIACNAGTQIYTWKGTKPIRTSHRAGISKQPLHMGQDCCNKLWTSLHVASKPPLRGPHWARAHFPSHRGKGKPQSPRGLTSWIPIKISGRMPAEGRSKKPNNVSKNRRQATKINDHSAIKVRILVECWYDLVCVLIGDSCSSECLNNPTITTTGISGGAIGVGRLGLLLSTHVYMYIRMCTCVYIYMHIIYIYVCVGLGYLSRHIAKPMA